MIKFSIIRLFVVAIKKQKNPELYISSTVL